jgi:hypothetical protein
LLIVSFFYPPFSSIGGLRVSKMSRNLLDLGWDVRVLTTDRDDLPADLPVEIPADRILRATYRDVNALPKALVGRRRVRSRGFEVSPALWPARIAGAIYRDLTNFPDGQIGWYRPAVRAGRLLAERWKPDLVLSSALPATAHLVARSLALRLGVPWIAEYRDPWTDSGSRRRMEPLYRVERALEDRVVRDAAALITVSDSWAAQLHQRFPHAPVSVVSNGYDPSDYNDAGKPPSGLPLTLLYTGRLYPRQDVSPLFHAIRASIDNGTLSPDDLRVRFVGRYLEGAREAAHSMNLLGSVVTVDESIPHLEALAAQQRSHVLVMALGLDDDVGWRPAKLYEYLGARRPILMIGGTDRHEARAILRDCAAGVALTDADEIARQLVAWSRELRTEGGVAFSGNLSKIDAFDRAALAKVLDRALRVTLG